MYKRIKARIFQSIALNKTRIIAWVFIAVIWMLIGLFIFSKITDYHKSQKNKYTSAVQVRDPDVFTACFNAHAANILAYGKLKAEKPVSFSQISGTYMSITRYKQHYTKHVDQIRYWTGRVWTYREEEYWSWDTVKVDEKHCDKINFLGMKFSYDQCPKPSREQKIGIIKESRHTRYVFYARQPEYTGTMFLETSDIGFHGEFKEDCTIQQFIKNKKDYASENICFWILWVCGGLVLFCLYYIEKYEV